jgi:hypothetical protein
LAAASCACAAQYGLKLIVDAMGLGCRPARRARANVQS